MTKWWRAVLLVLCCLVVGACSVSSRAATISVSDVIRAGRTPPSTLVDSVVIDVLPGQQLLVELSDGIQDQQIWVTGFSEAPVRGAEVWTSILGPPTPNDLVGVAYPSAGSLAAPPIVKHVTARSALAIVVGAVGSAALIAFALAIGVGRSRTSRARRCRGCGRPVSDAWLSCPSCGSGFSGGLRPIEPTPELVTASWVAPAPSYDDQGGGIQDAAGRPTRIIGREWSG